jgi:hypothetical protein
MTSNRRQSVTREYTNVSTIDRLALSRAQHFQSRENRPKSISDDEDRSISDWSDSDRECDVLSDFESTTDIRENNGDRHFYDVPFDEDNKENKFSQLNIPFLSTNDFRVGQIPLTYVDDSTTSTQVSFPIEAEKSKQQFGRKTSISSIRSGKPPQPPLLPARRIQAKQISPYHSVARSNTNIQLSSPLRNPKPTITPTPTRPYLHRENTSSSINFNSQLTDSMVSSHNLFYNHDNNLNRRQATSPSSSQASIPRAYEIKKIFVDDYDYGRLTDSSSIRPSQSRSRQKWGTIVHPPFPLGYQHIAHEQVTQAVERLASPLRCRDRHTHIPTSSKRYLSVEETDALVKNEVIVVLCLIFFLLILR